MCYFIDSPTHPIPAETPSKLVEYMKSTSHAGKQLTVSAYMLYFAQSFTDFSEGLLLRTDSADHFVVDLIAYGWLYIT